jgi:hypothetical protein
MNLPYEELTIKETKKRYPHFNLDDISQVVMDTEAGYLLARMGCIEHIVLYINT